MRPHLSLEELERWLDAPEELTEAESRALALHLDSCPSCCTLYESFLQDPEVTRWRDLLRDPANTPGSPLVPPRPASVPPGAGPANPLGYPFPPSPTPGHLGCLGDLDIVKPLGSGAMGAVFQAWDNRLRRWVAVKVLRLELSTIPTFRKRFEAEGRAAAAVRHQHVVAVYNIDSVPDFPLPYLVMEHVDGESLADRLKRAGALPPKDCAAIARQVAEGLAAAHRQGLLHQDVKPSNILLGREGALHARLTDFGLARALDDTERATHSSVRVGTPSYMSPEQAQPHKSLDARSDQFSLGVVLYEMLTGECPFRGTHAAVLQQIVHDEPRPPRKLNEKVPLDLETICLKCLSKEPQRRYPSCEQLVEDLDRWQGDRPIRARRLRAPERCWRWCRRHPLSAALAAGLVLAVLVGFAATWWQLCEKERALAREQRHRREADESSRQAFELVQDLRQLIQSPEMRASRFRPRRRELMETVLQHLARLSVSRGADDRLVLERTVASTAMGEICLELGLSGEAVKAYRRAEGLLAEATRLRPGEARLPRLRIDVARGLAQALDSQGHAGQAWPHWQEARRLLEEAERRAPGDAGQQRLLATVLAYVGYRQAALAPSAEGLADLRAAIALRRALLARSPDDPEAHRQFGLACHTLAKVTPDSKERRRVQERAARAYRQTKALWDKSVAWGEGADPLERAILYVQKARLQLSMNGPKLTGPQQQEAADWLQRGVQFATRASRAAGDFPLAQQLTGKTLYYLGKLQFKLRHVKEAEHTLEAACICYRAAFKGDPSNARARRELGVCLHELGRVAEDRESWPKAAAAYRKALRLRQELHQAHRDDLQLRLDLSATAYRLGRALEKDKQPEKARPAYEEALRQQRFIWREGPREKSHRTWLDERYRALQGLLCQLGKRAEAAALEREWRNEPKG